MSDTKISERKQEKETKGTIKNFTYADHVEFVGSEMEQFTIELHEEVFHVLSSASRNQVNKVDINILQYRYIRYMQLQNGLFDGMNVTKQNNTYQVCICDNEHDVVPIVKSSTYSRRLFEEFAVGKMYFYYTNNENWIILKATNIRHGRFKFKREGGTYIEFEQLYFLQHVRRGRIKYIPTAMASSFNI